MLLITLKIVLLLSSIVIPLSTKKNKVKKGFDIDTDTTDATYAINENGLLEKIHRPSLQIEDTE